MKPLFDYHISDVAL